MAEIPELGINAKGSYAIQEGSSISEIYHEAAGTLCHSVSSSYVHSTSVLAFD